MKFETAPEDKKPLYGEEMINHCLETGSVSQEISMENFNNLVQKTPEGTVFTVAEERYRRTFEHWAKNLGRKDIEFVLEQEDTEK